MVLWYAQTCWQDFAVPPLPSGMEMVVPAGKWIM